MNIRVINLSVAKRSISEATTFYRSPWYFRKVRILGLYSFAFLLSGFLLYSIGNFTDSIVAELRPHEKRSPTVTEGEPIIPTAGFPEQSAKRFFSKDARKESLKPILTVWGLDKKVEGEASQISFADLAEKQGFRVLAMDMDLNEISSLNLPVVLELRNIKKETGYLPIVGMLGERVYIDPDGKFSVSRKQVEKFLTGRAYVFWRDFEKIGNKLQKGNKGKRVAWLNKSLYRMGYEVSADSNSYEVATEEAVAAFQKNMGIKFNGVAGYKTLLKMYSLLPEYKTPRISIGS